MRDPQRILAVFMSVALSGATACAALGSAPAASSGPIKVGMVTSLTGNYAPLGTNDKLAAQQIVDGVNARNGVNGRKIELEIVDQAGIQLVDDETFETSQTNFAPQFAKIADTRPDFLLVWATGAPPVVITKGWADLKNGIPLMMTAAEASTLYVQPAGAAAEGVFVQGSMGVLGQSLPASNKFKKLIDDFAGPFQQANNYYPPQFAWDGMLAATFLVDAITRKGATSEQIKDGLDSIDLDTPQGHYTFTSQKHAGMPDSANLMTVVKDAQFVPAPGLSQDVLARAGQ